MFVCTVVAQNDTLDVGKNAELGCSIQEDLYTQVDFKWYRAEDTENELKNGDKYQIDHDNDTLTIKNTGEYSHVIYHKGKTRVATAQGKQLIWFLFFQTRQIRGILFSHSENI